jgi:hypothetical protein
MIVMNLWSVLSLIDFWFRYKHIFGDMRVNRFMMLAGMFLIAWIRMINIINFNSCTTSINLSLLASIFL